MSNQVREILFSLQLDPELESDRQALAALKQWYQRAKVINSDNDSFDFFALRLHKNIYLSGLFLCLLEPRLVKFFSQHLQAQNLTPEFLRQALAEHRLIAADGASAADASHFAPDELATRIADQLSPLLNGKGEALSTNEQNAQLQAQVSMLSEQLKEQRSLLQQQARLLDSLTRSGVQGHAEPGNVHAMAPAVPGEPQLHDLSATAAKVRKVREKGVF